MWDEYHVRPFFFNGFRIDPIVEIRTANTTTVLFDMCFPVYILVP